jgi:hypothetical protein
LKADDEEVVRVEKRWSQAKIPLSGAVEGLQAKGVLSQRSSVFFLDAKQNSKLHREKIT